VHSLRGGDPAGYPSKRQLSPWTLGRTFTGDGKTSRDGQCQAVCVSARAKGLIDEAAPARALETRTARATRIADGLWRVWRGAKRSKCCMAHHISALAPVCGHTDARIPRAMRVLKAMFARARTLRSCCGVRSHWTREALRLH